MNILELEMEAFGPFAQTCLIDFRASLASGLFLIQGPTGAGKTSILDAICFALYGESSGAERGAAGLRSQHVAETQATRVRLIFSCNDQVYQVQRSMSGRKSAQISEKASLELLGQERRVIADKRVELNQKIVGLIRLDSHQFRQVIVLPQGRFRDFLVAKSAEREAILKSLFDTERLADLVERIADRRRAAEQDLRKIQAEQEFTLGALGLGEADDPKDYLGKLTEKLAMLESNLSESAILAQAARQAYESATQQAKLLGEYTAAEQKLAELTGGEPIAGRQRLIRANRIAPYAHLPDLLRQATQAAQAHSQQLDQSNEALKKLETEHKAQENLVQLAALGKAEAGPLQDKIQGLQRQKEKLASLEQTRRKLDEALAEAAQNRSALASLAEVQREFQLKKADLAREQTAVRQWAELPGQFGELRLAVAELQRISQNEINAESEFLKLQEQTLDLAKEIETIEKELSQTRQAIAELEAITVSHSAALLARQLQSGQACPVCGSPHHPHPAAFPGDVPAPENLDQARIRLAEQESQKSDVATRHAVSAAKIQEIINLKSAHAEGSRELRGNLKKLLSELEPAETPGELGFGVNLPAELSRFCAQLGTNLGQATFTDYQEWLGQIQAFSNQNLAAQRSLGQLQRQSVSLEDSGAQNLSLSQQRQTALAVAEDRVKHLAEQAQAETAAIFQSLEPGATQLPVMDEISQTISGLSSEVDSRLKAWEQAGTTMARLDRELAAAQSRHQELARQAENGQTQAQSARQAWEQAWRQADFPDSEAAIAAILGEKERQALQAEIADWDREFALATQRSQSLSAQCADLAMPDLEGLKTRLDQAESSQRQNLENLAIAKQDYQRGRDAIATLEDLGRQYQLSYNNFESLTGLCRLLQGQESETGYVNLQRYALSVYLDEILDHANRHLADMSRGRYALVRQDLAGGKNKTGGLELQISDSYTGQQRGTESLSGGESFLAALALALGLSSVVHAQAGGVRIDTLFVDEGFGSLDEEALQEAMTVLGALQERGRSVGIISHVRELQERIQLQLLVTRGATGSLARWNNGLSEIPGS